MPSEINLNPPNNFTWKPRMLVLKGLSNYMKDWLKKSQSYKNILTFGLQKKLCTIRIHSMNSGA